ncbi:Gp49 family protein [Pseudoduganella chitinolytica]|uniref:Gp49 family protein n=1 Tax=Pseudoduganella chitinolytica TaxID=34070 RepID=A0ABY8BHP8_9BURK|nr:Gp49 family protein [Pseudoduganella chitinolytica]WEF34878.1 Gp49 family protein [Pseudoduganella chitinolytica]
MNTYERTHMTDTTQQTAPRVTAERIDALVASLTYETARVPNTTSTVATSRLPWGFVVSIGHSACVSPANFDAEKGRKYAIEDAAAQSRAKLWELEGYRLAYELAHQGKAGAA